MKVFHILYQSLPQTSGSSIRSRDILLSQKSIGVDVVAITSPFQHSITGNEYDTIQGIKYYRTSKKKKESNFGSEKSTFEKVKKLISIFSFLFQVNKWIGIEKPEIIHAHAMFYCAIPALIIGKLRNIPVIYEFRSLWMYDVKKDEQRKQKSYISDFWFKLEVFLLNKSDYVVFLNKNLENYFIEKGYSFKNSIVIDNAVNVELIKDVKNIKPKKNEANDIRFGYIGTLTPYEGLILLIETFQELYDEGYAYKLLIYGDGEQKNEIQKIIELRNDVPTIEYKGRIKSSEIYKAYNQIDVVINPRIKSQITDSVTPLKPLEAMAYEKLFIGSDVGGIVEIVKSGENGVLFKADNKESLKENLHYVFNLSEYNQTKIKSQALKYVENHKSWHQNAYRYLQLYQKLI